MALLVAHTTLLEMSCDSYTNDFQIEGEHKGWVPGFLKFGGTKPPVSPPTTPVRRSTIATSVNRAKDNVNICQLFVFWVILLAFL